MLVVSCWDCMASWALLQAALQLAGDGISTQHATVRDMFLCFTI